MSWSWEATLIVYWGDFSLEGYYLHMRNSYTFNSSCGISVLFCTCLLAVLKSFLPSFLTCGCETLMLVCVESPSVFNLKSLLQSVLVGWKWCTLHFQINIGPSRSSLSNRKNAVVSDGICAYVDPDVGVKIHSPVHNFYERTVGCPCIAWYMLNL